MSTEGSQTRPPGCLSDFVLDRLVSHDLGGGPEEAGARSHLAGCARCTARLAAFEAVEMPSFAELESKAETAATWKAPPPVARPATAPGGFRAGAPRRSWVGGAIATGFMVAACAAALFVFRQGPRPGEIPGSPATSGEASTRTKGSATLAVIARRASGETVRLGQGDAVAPGDALRFEIAVGRPVFAAVFGLDAAGQVTAYVPLSGTMLPVPGGPPAALPGSIIADETLGAERIAAFVCGLPRPVDDLRATLAAALARAGNDPNRVPVGDLVPGCTVSVFSIDKRRP